MAAAVPVPVVVIAAVAAVLVEEVVAAVAVVPDNKNALYAQQNPILLGQFLCWRLGKAVLTKKETD